jgi:hypothetical protein
MGGACVVLCCVSDQTSEELKDLEKKLQVAYVNKDRAAQHQERFLLAKMER